MLSPKPQSLTSVAFVVSYVPAGQPHGTRRGINGCGRTDGRAGECVRATSAVQALTHIADRDKRTEPSRSRVPSIGQPSSCPFPHPSDPATLHLAHSGPIVQPY